MTTDKIMDNKQRITIVLSSDQWYALAILQRHTSMDKENLVLWAVTEFLENHLNDSEKRSVMYRRQLQHGPRQISDKSNL